MPAPPAVAVQAGIRVAGQGQSAKVQPSALNWSSRDCSRGALPGFTAVGQLQIWTVVPAAVCPEEATGTFAEHEFASAGSHAFAAFNPARYCCAIAAHPAPPAGLCPPQPTAPRSPIIAHSPRIGTFLFGPAKVQPVRVRVRAEYPRGVGNFVQNSRKPARAGPAAGPAKSGLRRPLDRGDAAPR